MSVSDSLAELQRNGFPMGGEPLVALDLADTMMTAVDPAVDLLDSPERAMTWWALELPRLPKSAMPELAATKRLRSALRDLFDAHLAHRRPSATSVEDVNALAAAVPNSRRLVVGKGGVVRADTRWHTEFGGNVALAAIAREAIALLSAPEQAAKLRRCANPGCSMVFLAEISRRQWCTSNICGNRMRVARHYQRSRATRTEST